MLFSAAIGEGVDRGFSSRWQRRWHIEHVRPRKRTVRDYRTSVVALEFATLLACFGRGVSSWRWWEFAYSPSLPLPPPSPPDEASAGPNLVHLHGSANSVEAGSVVLIINYDPQFTHTQQATATLANSDGSWDATVTSRSRMARSSSSR